MRIGGGHPLVDADPERYGTLQHPGDRGSFDIFTQAGRAVGSKRSTDVDPLGGLDVRRVIAAGASQSAMRLAAYHNAVHPAAGEFDAFLLAVWEGRAPRLEEGAVAMGVRTTLRTDQATPVVVVNSEFEAKNLAALGTVDTDHLRVWEVAGTPHAVVRGSDGADHDGWGLNRLSYAPVHDAALRATHRWLAEGVSPVSQPRIGSEPGAPPKLRRDQYGNVVGGIRLPELAAPTHEYRGMSFGTGRAPLFGAARRLPDDVLVALYPTRATYLDRWHAAVDALVASGALRPEDAPEMHARGETVVLPVL
jgi:hypothetical protein